MPILRALVLAATGLLALTASAFAQADYPNRPIRLIIPFPPGGGIDVVVRAVGAELGAGLGGDADLVPAALTQSRLRARGERKFGDAARSMLFTVDGLEQATRQQVARLHARRLGDSGTRRVFDLGCGVGADARAFAEVATASPASWSVVMPFHGDRGLLRHALQSHLRLQPRARRRLDRRPRPE